MQWLPWPDAAGAAAGAAVLTRPLAGRARSRPLAAWTRELAVMFGLYALWQLAGTLSLGRLGSAMARGAAITRAESDVGLPSEASFQRLFLHSPDLVRAMNLYYFTLHVAVTGVCLVWIFARHRDRYPVVRNTLAVATGVSLLVALIPVAPPRLVPSSGTVDTGRLFGPTVYPATARPGLDQLSAMPSVHVAWALIAAGALIYSLRSAWRWLAVAHPVVTVVVVVATGNHYWADAAAAVVICAVAVAVASGLRASGGKGPSGTGPPSYVRSSPEPPVAAARRSAPVSPS